MAETVPPVHAYAHSLPIYKSAASETSRRALTDTLQNTPSTPNVQRYLLYKTQGGESHTQQTAQTEQAEKAAPLIQFSRLLYDWTHEAPLRAA